MHIEGMLIEKFACITLYITRTSLAGIKLSFLVPHLGKTNYIYTFDKGSSWLFDEYARVAPFIKLININRKKH